MLRALASVLILTPFTLLVVLFAVSNRQLVEVMLFPLPGSATLPLYLLVLGVMALGFLVGALMMWVLALGARLTARRESRRAGKLEKELTELRAAALKADAPPASSSASAISALPVV